MLTFSHHIHFLAQYYYIYIWWLQGAKPWRFTGKEENMQREDIKMLIKKWWDIYADDDDDDSLAKTSPEDDDVQFVSAPSAA